MLQESILQYFQPSLGLPFVVKTFVLSVFEWPFKTGFTVAHLEPMDQVSKKSFVHNCFIKKKFAYGSSELKSFVHNCFIQKMFYGLANVWSCDFSYFLSD